MCRTSKSTLRFTALMSIILPVIVLLLWPSGAQTPNGLPGVASGGTRGPCALVFSRDGHQAYIVEQDTNSVAILDADSGKSIATIPSGGKEPTGIAITEDGRTLAVANSFSGSVGLLSLEKRTLRATLPIPGGPYGIVAAGGRVWVSVSRLDQVAVIDPASAKVLARISVGRRPRAITATPDGATLICANMDSGDLSLIDVRSMREVARVPVGAINLRGVAVNTDGTHAYVTGQQPHNDVPTDRPEAMWSNVLCVVRLDGGQQGVSGKLESTLTLDAPDRGAADPYGVAVSGDTAYVTLGGTHELARVALDPASPSVQRTVVGANPRAVAIRPGGEVWVANTLGNSLTIHDSQGTRERVVELEPSVTPDVRLHGRYLFSSAHLTRGMRFTCNTCHPDGNMVGVAWKFAHVHDGLDLRVARNLRGVLLLTGPYGWTGRVDDFESFVNDEIEFLLKGSSRLPHGQIHGFWDLVNDMSMPPNPYRAPDGSFTEAALRGQALFKGAAGCATCHDGALYGGTGKRVWIGTTPESVTLDVPHLIGVYDAHPYLHDGRAATLEEIFTRCNASHLHGKAHLLTPAQMSDLIEFVREL